MRLDLGALYSNNSDNWETPDEIKDLVHSVAPIGLDPCTTLVNPMAAKIFYTLRDDGLTKDWSLPDWAKDDLVYVNFPYSEAAAWTKKIADEVAADPSLVVIGCFPARTETKWFHSWVWPSLRSICFLKGRLSFFRPLYADDANSPIEPIGRQKIGNAPFPSVVVYFGNDRHLEKFKKVFKEKGKICQLDPSSEETSSSPTATAPIAEKP